MSPVVRQIAVEYRNDLYHLYGNDLAEVILFGSHARGDFRDDSDIDFAIVLKQPDIRPSEEITKIISIESRLSLKYGLMISSLPVSLQKKQSSMQGIYQEIRKEGIVI